MDIRKEYEEYLNEIGCPDHDHPENNGRVPWEMVEQYGTWLRENDPIAFNVGCDEFEQENQ